MKVYLSMGQEVFFLILVLLFPMRLQASGYSEYENYRIWQLRVAAAEYASLRAQELCEWSPGSSIVYADQFLLSKNVSNDGLLMNSMAMLRLDQNARAISDARGDRDHISSSKAQEVDAENLVRLKSIFARYGFPTIEQVGESGVDAMMLMVAHADADLEFQRSVLLNMEEEVEKGVLPAVYPAALKAIRPRISHGETARAGVRDTKLPDANADSSGPINEKVRSSPRQCYHHRRSDIIDSYIRSRYVLAPEVVSLGVGASRMPGNAATARDSQMTVRP